MQYDRKVQYFFFRTRLVMNYQKYVWIYLSLILLNAVFGAVLEEPEGEGEGEGEEDFGWQKRTSALTIATLLIVLSILFELAKDKIEETTSEDLKPVVDHLFQGNLFCVISCIVSFHLIYIFFL